MTTLRSNRHCNSKMEYVAISLSISQYIKLATLQCTNSLFIRKPAIKLMEHRLPGRTPSVAMACISGGDSSYPPVAGRGWEVLIQRGIYSVIFEVGRIWLCAWNHDLQL